MRSRLLLAPVLVFAVGVDGVIGCTCEEILDQTPKPVAVLVYQDQLAPPAENLDIGLPTTQIGTPVVGRFEIENRGNAPLNVSDIVIASDPVLCPSPSAAFVITAPVQLAGAARSAVIEPGGTTQVEVQFSATSGQPACAVVEVRGDDVVSPVLKARLAGQGDAPQLCVDRGIVDFGTVFVGDRKEETITLSSCGTRAFQLDGGTLNAMFPEPFELVTPITAGSIDVGTDIVLTVAFDPETPGSFSGATAGTIDLDTDLDGAFRLQLVGVAQLPPACRIQAVPNAVQFGSVGAGRTSTQSVLVRNIGELDCTFTSAVVVTGGSFSRTLTAPFADNTTLAPQALGEVKVTFAPTSFVGVESDILRVTTTDPVNAVIDVPLQGTSVEVQPCFLEAVPTAVNFGFQTLRRSKETEVILKNVGTENCIVTTADITIGAPEFTIIEPPFTALADQLPPIIADLFPFGAIVPDGGQISFIVGFRPEQAGPRNGNYRFEYKEQGFGNPTQTIDVPATGDGVAPCLRILPLDVDFGAVATGSSANRDVSIQNCGGADLAIRGVGLRSGSHPDFSVPTTPSLPATLAPGATIPVTVRAAPTTNGVALAGASMFGTLDIMSDDVTTGVSLRANTNGACVNGLVCSPRTLEFGDVLMGEDLVRSVVCNNPTTSPIAVTPAVAAPFTLVSPPTTVAAGGQAVIRVRFTPTTTTQATQTLRLGANDCSGAAIGVAVRGRGADDELPACPVNPAFDPQLKWDWNGATAVDTRASHEVWVTPLVSRLGDTTGDGVVTRDDMPRVIFVSFDRSKVSSPLSSQESINDPIPSELRAIDGATGAEVWTTSIGTGPAFEHAVQSAATPAVADIDGDGKVEIIAQKYILLPGVETIPGGPKINGKFARGFLIAFNFDGSFKWVSDEWSRRSDELEDGGAPAIGDVDGDGFAEIAIGDHLFDHTGRLLWRGDGTKIGSTGHGPTSVLADVDGQAGLELVCGSRVYRSDGTILWDRDNVPDGHVAIADLDGNGTNEIVVRGAEIHVLNGATGASLVTPFIPPTRELMPRECQAPPNDPANEDDSPCSIIPTNPAILNYDGGNDLEIFTSNQELITGYKLVGGQLQEIFRENIYDGSGASGPAGFDFDGDGDEELVYADENKLRTWSTGGTQTFEGDRQSVTIFEYAVIADIDLDGHAEMLVASNSPFIPAQFGGVRAYANRGVSWAQARSIWNQHAYVEAIISELGVPLFETTPTALPGFRNARARCVPN